MQLDASAAPTDAAQEDGKNAWLTSTYALNGVRSRGPSTPPSSEALSGGSGDGGGESGGVGDGTPP